MPGLVANTLGLTSFVRLSDVGVAAPCRVWPGAAGSPGAQGMKPECDWSKPVVSKENARPLLRSGGIS